MGEAFSQDLSTIENPYLTGYSTAYKCKITPSQTLEDAGRTNSQSLDKTFLEPIETEDSHLSMPPDIQPVGVADVQSGKTRAAVSNSHCC
jgi:hypothetical protein